jgi:anti-sigma B factor antagonist
MLKAEQTTEPTSGTLVVRLIGDADLASHDTLEAAGERVVEAAPKLAVIDCTSLRFLASPGIEVLLGLAQSLRTRGGRLALAGASKLVGDMITRSKLSHALPVYPSVHDAIGALTPGAR